MICINLVIDRGWLEVLHVFQDYGRYGVQSLEDKQKLFRLIKTINSGADSASAPQTPRDYSPSASNHIGMDGFLAPELRGDFNSGILDLHSIDDTEFFPEVTTFRYPNSLKTYFSCLVFRTKRLNRAFFLISE